MEVGSQQCWNLRMLGILDFGIWDFWTLGLANVDYWVWEFVLSCMIGNFKSWTLLFRDVGILFYGCWVLELLFVNVWF